MNTLPGLLLSIRPRFAQGIFDGAKTVELRRRAPDIVSGALIAIYEASPTMALRGFARISGVASMCPTHLWPEVSTKAMLTKAEFSSYFYGTSKAFALHITQCFALLSPVPLARLRELEPAFQPPQSYRFVSSLNPALQEFLNAKAAEALIRCSRKP